MICKYKYNGNEFKSYSELLNWLDSNLEKEGINELSDDIFSKSLKSQQEISDIIDNLKENYIPIRNNNLIDDDPRVQGSLSILEFLDTEHWKHTTPFNEQDYKNALITKLSESMSKEEAIKEYEKLYRHLKQVLQDVLNLHPNFTNSAIWSSKKSALDFRNAIPLTFKDLLETPIETLDNLYVDLHKWYMSTKGNIPNSIRKTNINLSTEIEGLSEKIFGHIDYLFIGDDGSLNLYLFKTSDQEYSKWPDVKKNRIRYLLAFLKRMLQNKGIFVKDATLNIVPLLLVYNESGKISEIKWLPSRNERLSSTRGGTYAMNKYDRLVAPFIKDNSIPFHISELPILRAIDITNKMFYSLNIKLEGISRSAKIWIQNAPDEEYEGEPLVIKHIGDVDHGYDVIIGNKTYAVKSNKSRLLNKEIEDIVKAHINELNDNRGYYTARLKNAIRNRFRKGFSTFEQEKGFSAAATRLETVLLSKYLLFSKRDENGKPVYDWELLEDFLDCNVLVFKNKNTNVVDFISLTAFDLGAKAPLAKGQNILGDYRRDSEFIDLEGTYGNIEIVKTMNLINEILPKLGNVMLGTVNALSTIGTSSLLSYNIAYFNKTYYLKILSELKKEKIDIPNNFIHALFLDVRADIILTYNSIINKLDNTEKNQYTSYGFEDYINANSIDELVATLYNILLLILNIFPLFADWNMLQKELPNNTFRGNLANLYKMVTEAFLTITGQAPVYTIELSDVELTMMTAPTISDPNIRTVVNNLLITHDTISSLFLNIYDTEIRPKIDTYYNEIGYTSLLNRTIGNQAMQYSNMYNQDSELFSFKNPYDNSNDLTSLERKFLKFALYQIAKIRHNNSFEFSSENDSRLPQYISKHPEYLWVPLEKASNATVRLSGEAVHARMKNFWRRVTNLGESFDLAFNNLLPEELRMISGNDQDFYSMLLINSFDTNLYNSREDPSKTLKRRKDMLKKYGKGFFETNLENILVDILALLISSNLFLKLIISSKALLLNLLITGDFFGNNTIVDKEIDYIQKYLKINAFKTPVVGKTELKIIGTIIPIKKVVTDMVLGGNVVSMFRDLMEGALLNFIRSVIKLNTDISPSSVRKAYTFVASHATTDAMAVNLLSKLCLKYRLSNTDVGRIAERAKSGRGGILNFENMMYGTLRTPDFVNRMTLFIARCIEDGVVDGDNLMDMNKHAYFIDKDGRLQYDWRKDKRFSLYAKGDKSNLEAYNKLKSLFLSKIRQYKIEQANPEFGYDNLPEPYTDQEIMTIRALGDSIYGSYDRGKKAMNENLALGILFGMFTTWMNGIISNYMMKPLKNNVTRLKKSIALNDKGEELYFDEYGNLLTLAEGGNKDLPVWDDEPVIVLGIYYTVKELVKICRNDGLDVMKEYVKANPQEKANIKKLISDLLMWLIMGCLFKFVATPAYKEFKKGGHERTVLANLIAEWAYKPASRSYDLFKGMFNVLSFFGENLNPPYFTVPVLVMTEAAEALFGEKSWKYLIFDNLGITRSIRDTAFAYIKSQL